MLQQRLNLKRRKKKRRKRRKKKKYLCSQTTPSHLFLHLLHFMEFLTVAPTSYTTSSIRMQWNAWNLLCCLCINIHKKIFMSLSKVVFIFPTFYEDVCILGEDLRVFIMIFSFHKHKWTNGKSRVRKRSLKEPNKWFCTMCRSWILID